MSTNRAAWLKSAKAKPLTIDSAPMWKPEANEILIKNRAIAINPIDYGIQNVAMFPLQYPSILGFDVAGEVVTVGSNVARFKEGDRVTGLCINVGKERVQENAFQLYTILREHMATSIPAEMTFEQAAVMPLGLSTAACGLFQGHPYLNLPRPTSPARSSTGKTILVWGGASSVGSNGIQLAVAAGYEVIATASPKNFALVKGLGASQVFDYRSPSIQADLLAAFEGKECAGALDCIGGEACTICVQVVHRTAGKGFVATTKGGAENVPEGVEVGRIFGTTLNDNGVGKAVWEDFLPGALEKGSFVAFPPAEVVGEGLEKIQEAIDVASKGVSAKKIVVRL